MLRRLAVALTISAALMAAATTGMYVTRAPALVSLLIEPFSLLLMPGLAVSLPVAGAHDLSPLVVVGASFGFYFLLIYMALWWRSRRSRLARRRSR